MVDRRMERGCRCPSLQMLTAMEAAPWWRARRTPCGGPPLAAAVRLIGPVGAAVIRSTTGFLRTWIPMLVLA